MPTKEELLAHQNNSEVISRLYSKLVSEKFLSLNGLYQALVGGRRNSQLSQFSDRALLYWRISDKTN